MQPDRQRIYIYEITRRIGEILHYMWDPIGVRGVPEARDEYDSYIAQVFSLLERAASDSEVAGFLTKTSTETMGMTGTQEASRHDLEISRLLIQHFGIIKKQYEKTEPNRVEVAGLRLPPLPHHPACGSAPGGSNQTR